MGSAHSQIDRAKKSPDIINTEYVAGITSGSATAPVLYQQGQTREDAWKTALGNLEGQTIDEVTFTKGFDLSLGDMIGMFDKLTAEKLPTFAEQVVVKIPRNFSDLDAIKTLRLAEHANKVSQNWENRPYFLVAFTLQ